MSFFDEAEETRRPPRPRRSASNGASPPDSQTLLIRRAVAAGIALVVLIVLVLGVRSCLNSRTDRALKAYNRSVASLVKQSDAQVSKPLFETLASGSGSATDEQQQVNQLKADADKLYDRTKGLDVPSQMAAAQQNLLLTMSLRREAVTKIAQKLSTALGSRNPTQAVNEIAAENQAFLTSDVVYKLRAAPFIKDALDDADISGQSIASSQSLPSLDWLDRQYVARQLDVSVTGTSGARNGPPAPGLHGHALDSVTAGGVTLEPGGANRIPASSNLAFTVKFTNGGENDEQDVDVSIGITGSGKPITVKKTVPQTQAGAETSVSIPLGTAPPIGAPVTITVEIAKVPGEEKLDNNKQTFPAIFTR